MSHFTDRSNLTNGENAASAKHAEPESLRDPRDPEISSDTGEADSSPPQSDEQDIAPPQPAFTESKLAFLTLAAAFRRDVATLAQRSLAASSELVNTLKSGACGAGRLVPNDLMLRAASGVGFLGRKLFASFEIFTKPSWLHPIRPWSLKRGILAMLASLLILVTGTLVWALQDVPWTEIAAGSLKPVVVLEAADGEPIVRQGPFQGPYARYEEFPAHLVNAVLSIEDRRFMDHYGVDVKGIMRAVLRNLQAGSVVQGGSTITQQLIKVQYLESDRTLKRNCRNWSSHSGSNGSWVNARS